MRRVRLRRTLGSRYVLLVFSSLVGLWVFNMVSYPIGKPLDPIFSVVFWAFFRFEPQLSHSFVLQLVVFYVWFVGYCYLLAVLVVGLSRGVMTLGAHRERQAE